MPNRIGVVALACVPLVDASTFRFIGLGDWGMGGYAAGNIAEVMSAINFHHLAEEFDAQFTINVGDQLYMPNVAEGLQQSWRDTWLKPGSHGGGIWFCTRGNHDNFPPQVSYTQQQSQPNRVGPGNLRDLWWFPSAFYVREIDTHQGYKVGIWGVDSNGGGTDGGWMDRSLSRSKARWKFLTTHFPAYNSGRHKRVGPPLGQANMAMKHGVQMFFTGHDHIVQLCVTKGVMFVQTGATSRGAMMARPLCEAETHFVFTIGRRSSVGQHGFFQFQTTKNVAWGSLHGHGSMVYEFTTVWDWPHQYMNKQQKGYKLVVPPVGKQALNALPHRSLVLEYLKQEAEEYAAAGGVPGESAADHKMKEMGGSAAAPPPTPPQTQSPTTAEPVKAPPPAPPAAAASTHASADVAPKVSEAAHKAVERTAHTARYVVATECQHCLGPSMNVPFTLWVQGVETTDAHRLFLTFDQGACATGDENLALGGRDAVRVLKDPVQNFVARVSEGGSSSGSAPVYTCLSADGGKNYQQIVLADSNLPAFTLHPEPPGAGHGASPKLDQQDNNGEDRSPVLMGVGGVMVMGAPILWWAGRRSP